MSKLDFKTILTKEDLSSLTMDKYEFAIKEALPWSNKVRAKVAGDYSYITTRSREISMGCKYNSESNTVKELIAANISYPDSEKMIKVLLDKGITYERLFMYSRLVSSCKKMSLLQSQDKAVELKAGRKELNDLCNIFIPRDGLMDKNLLIAKLNEIVVFNGDLYKSLQRSKQKTR